MSALCPITIITSDPAVTQYLTDSSYAVRNEDGSWDVNSIEQAQHITKQWAGLFSFKFELSFEQIRAVYDTKERKRDRTRKRRERITKALRAAGWASESQYMTAVANGEVKVLSPSNE